jgi:hypothetical protein
MTNLVFSSFSVPLENNPVLHDEEDGHDEATDKDASVELPIELQQLYVNHKADRSGLILYEMPMEVFGM